MFAKLREFFDPQKVSSKYPGITWSSARWRFSSVLLAGWKVSSSATVDRDR